MADIGWIKLSRQICESWIFPNRRKFTEFEAWLYLLLKASFADSKIYDNGKLIEVKRGEILTSEIKLSYEWLWDRGTVRRFLKLLQSDGMILKKSHVKFTIITICNYVSYQDSRTAKTTTGEQQTNSRRTTDEQQANTLEEGKEDIKKIKEVYTPTLDEFLGYCKTFADLNLYRFPLTAKYEAWVQAGWKDGNGKQIKNWKTKIKSTMPYLKPYTTELQQTKISI